VRNVDRTVRDLQTQIERRDKVNAQLEDEITKGKEKLERMLKAVEELQVSDSEHQLVARRAEREAREEREKSLRLERELESWKGRSWMSGGHAGTKSGALAALSEMGDERDAADAAAGGRRGSKRHSVNFL
jgi:myosin protein heavy chain